MASCSTLMLCCSASTAPASSNKSQKALFDNIAILAAPDPYTVVLTLKHADPHALFQLGESAAVILHPDSASQASTYLIDTGPYTFSHGKKGWGIGLEKWKKHCSAANVKIVTAVFRFIFDPQEQALAGMGGDVDVFFNIATQHVAQFLPDKR